MVMQHCSYTRIHWIIHCKQGVYGIWAWMSYESCLKKYMYNQCNTHSHKLLLWVPFYSLTVYFRLLCSLKAKIRQLSYCLFPLFSLQWHPSLHDFIDSCQEKSPGPLLVCLCEQPRRSTLSHQALDVAITPVGHIYSQSFASFVHSLTASPRPRTRFDRQSRDQLHSVVFSGCVEEPASNFLLPTSCIPGSGNFSKVECLSFSFRNGLNFFWFS